MTSMLDTFIFENHAQFFTDRFSKTDIFDVKINRMFSKKNHLGVSI